MHTGAKKKINSTQIFVYCHLGKTQASSSSCSCEGELAEQDTHQVLVIVVAIVIVINIVFCRPVLQSFSQKKIFFSLITAISSRSQTK